MRAREPLLFSHQLQFKWPFCMLWDNAIELCNEFVCTMKHSLCYTLCKLQQNIQNHHLFNYSTQKPRPNQLTPKSWRYTIANFKLFWFNLYSVLLEIIWKKPHIFFIHNKHFSHAILFYSMPLIKCLFGMFWLFHYVGDLKLEMYFFLPFFKKLFATKIACSNAILYSFSTTTRNWTFSQLIGNLLYSRLKCPKVFILNTNMCWKVFVVLNWKRGNRKKNVAKLKLFYKSLSDRAFSLFQCKF